MINKIIVLNIILVWFFIPCSAQNIVKVTDTLKHVDLVENYEAIRRGDHYTKHGPYKMLNKEKQVVVNGSYQQDLKDGFWEYCDIESLKVIAEGNYTINLFTGIWEYYYPNGETRLIYDFKEDNILYHDNVNDADFFSYQSPAEEEIATNMIERFPTYASHWSPRTYLLFELEKRGIPLESLDSNGQLKLLVDMYGYMKVQEIKTNNETISTTLVEEIMYSYNALWIPAIIDNMMTEIIIIIKF